MLSFVNACLTWSMASLLDSEAQFKQSVAAGLPVALYGKGDWNNVFPLDKLT